ncbi:unnamed protein product [Protopolystoma xenopodis]|uniref:Uncharacterized protein n=1 Tax=Protopolystoma xenopodis TaxID=117903 RepID=A0A448X6G2_9PLAT|nr:unnamed protein product [Protopolystoma xenopodis]
MQLSFSQRLQHYSYLEAWQYPGNRLAYSIVVFVLQYRPRPTSTSLIYMHLAARKLMLYPPSNSLGLSPLPHGDSVASANKKVNEARPRTTEAPTQLQTGEGTPDTYPLHPPFLNDRHNDHHNQTLSHSFLRCHRHH